MYRWSSTTSIQAVTLDLRYIDFTVCANNFHCWELKVALQRVHLLCMTTTINQYCYLTLVILAVIVEIRYVRLS